MMRFSKTLTGVLLSIVIALNGSIAAFAADNTAYWSKMAVDNPTQFKTEAQAYENLDYNTVYTNMGTYKNVTPMTVFGEVKDFTVLTTGGCQGLIESTSGFSNYIISFHSNTLLPFSKGDFGRIYGIIDGYANYTSVDNWGVPKQVQTLSINALIGETRKTFTEGDISQDMKNSFFGTYEVVVGYIGEIDWDQTSPDPLPNPNNPEYDQTYAHRKITVNDTSVDGLPIKVERYYQTIAGTVVMYFRFTGPNWEEYYAQAYPATDRAWYESSRYCEKIEFDYDGTANFNVGEHYSIVSDEDGFYQFDYPEYGTAEYIRGDVINEDHCKKIK